ncbi:MAG: hypothetical protein AAF493_07925 [Pseudomonadota bacterium]
MNAATLRTLMGVAGTTVMLAVVSTPAVDARGLRPIFTPAATGTRVPVSAPAIRATTTRTTVLQGAGQAQRRFVGAGSLPATTTTLRPHVQGSVPPKGTLTKAFDIGKNAPNKAHVVYVRPGTRHKGRPYIGRASQPASHHTTQQAVVKRRYAGDKTVDSRKAKVLYSGYGAEGAAKARGLEQRMIERWRQRPIGVDNVRNGIGPRNKRRAAYLARADEALANVRKRAAARRAKQAATR